jgi:hypothetical protein
MSRMGAGVVPMLFGTIEERVCCSEVDHVQYLEVDFAAQKFQASFLSD